MWHLFEMMQPPSVLSHPFWVFEWDLLFTPEVPLCCATLFLSAVLCSAAGIGGGGIYVAVLMVLGGVSTHNAVPLSKAVVFFGAISSTVLNLRRQFCETPTAGNKGSIDFEVLRLVVPMALSGTFFGVCLNFHLPATVIVCLLTAILVTMTVMVVHTAWGQHLEEEVAARFTGIGNDAELAEETQPLMPRVPGAAGRGRSGSGGTYGGHDDAVGSPAAGQLLGGTRSTMVKQGKDEAIKKGKDEAIKKGKDEAAINGLTRSDVIMFALLVFIVVLGGILRFHFHACRAEKDGKGMAGSCRHPFVEKMFNGHLTGWMDHSTLSTVLQILATSLPFWACIAMSVYYGRAAKKAGWQNLNILTYQLTACATGLLAGLVGVGGGLVFSPFFLLMGLEPHVAVATSSTCVLFTSSSTTVQYLFTDRIMMSLAILYGCVTLFASWIGTSIVHLLQDRCRAKRSYITWVVAAGIAISAALSVAKFFTVLTQGEPLSPGAPGIKAA